MFICFPVSDEKFLRGQLIRRTSKALLQHIYDVFELVSLSHITVLYASHVVVVFVVVVGIVVLIKENTYTYPHL